MSHLSRISITNTIAKQSQQTAFGEVLRSSLSQGVSVAGMVGEAVLHSVPGAAVVSAAVSAVTQLSGRGPTTQSAASSGVVSINPGGPSANPAIAGDMAGMVNEMRAEANRSMAMQMAMQQESRDYNTISNILKVRHESAKAAINNIR